MAVTIIERSNFLSTGEPRLSLDKQGYLVAVIGNCHQTTTIANAQMPESIAHKSLIVRHNTTDQNYQDEKSAMKGKEIGYIR